MAYQGGEDAYVQDQNVYAAIASEMIGTGLQQWRNEEMAGKAWDQQKKMMRRRYQWMMADMEAAGLNPILAYQQGAPPNVPTMPFLPAVNPAEGMSSSVKQAMRVRGELEKLEKENKLLRDQSDKVRQDTNTSVWTEQRERTQAHLNERLAEQASASAKSLLANAKYTDITAKLAETGIPSARAAEELYKKYPALRQWSGILRSVQGQTDR